MLHPIVQLSNSNQSSTKFPTNASTQTERSSPNESVSVNKSNEILVPNEFQACNKCSTRKVIIAGDSLLDRIHIKRMKVNDIPSAKLTKRDDNLWGSIA